MQTHWAQIYPQHTPGDVRYHSGLVATLTLLACLATWLLLWSTNVWTAAVAIISFLFCIEGWIRAMRLFAAIRYERKWLAERAEVDAAKRHRAANDPDFRALLLAQQARSKAPCTARPERLGNSGAATNPSMFVGIGLVKLPVVALPEPIAERSAEVASDACVSSAFWRFVDEAVVAAVA